MYIELNECESKRRIRFRKEHISYYTPTTDGNREATLVVLLTGEVFRGRESVIDIDAKMAA